MNLAGARDTWLMTVLLAQVGCNNVVRECHCVLFAVGCVNLSPTLVSA